MGSTSTFKHSDYDFLGNEEEENEKSDEYNENKNTSKKRKSARQTGWYKINLKQIDECQLKLFGKEQPKSEYNLNNKA